MADMTTDQTAVASSPSSEGSRTTLLAILISVFLMGAGMGVQGSALSLRAGLEGYSNSLVGLIMSANYVGLIIGSLIAPILIRNVGYVRSFAASASLGSAAAISHLLLIDPVAWMVFRALTGLSLSVMFVVAESWLNSSSTSDNRGRLLSAYSVVYLVSMGAGQPLLALFPPAGFEIFCATTVLISLCLIPVAVMRVRGEPNAEREPPRLVRTFMKTPLAGSGVIVAGIMTGATWSLTPLYGQQIGLESGAIGMLMLLVSVGTLVLQWPLGWMSDKNSRRIAILWSSGISSLAAAFIVIFRPESTMLYLLIFLYGGFGMPLYSLSVAFANDHFKSNEMVQVAGAIVIYYGIGSVIGPVLGSQFMRWIGPTGLFLSMTLVQALLFVFALIRRARIPAVPKRKARFRLYPRMSPSAFRMLRKVRVRRKSSTV